MDIQATKLELMRLLLNTQKEQVLARIREVFEQEEGEEIVGYKPNGDLITQPELVARAEASERDIAEGRTISIHQFSQDLEKWKKEKRKSLTK